MNEVNATPHADLIEQEPVAWNLKAPPMWPQQKEGETFLVSYTTTPQQQPVFDCPRCGHVCSQRPWAGLTDGDWEWVADKKETSLDTFAYGAAWAADQLKEKNT